MNFLTFLLLLLAAFLIHCASYTMKGDEIQWRWMRIARRRAAHCGGGKTFLSIWCVCEMLNVVRPEGGGRSGWNGEFTCQNMRKIMASEFIQFRTFSLLFFVFSRSWRTSSLLVDAFFSFSIALLWVSAERLFAALYFLHCKDSYATAKKCFDFLHSKVLQPIQRISDFFFDGTQQIMNEHSTFICRTLSAKDAKTLVL